MTETDLRKRHAADVLSAPPSPRVPRQSYNELEVAAGIATAAMLVGMLIWLVVH